MLMPIMNDRFFNFSRHSAARRLLTVAAMILAVALAAFGCRDEATVRPADSSGGNAGVSQHSAEGKVRVATTVPSVVELIAAMDCLDQLVARGRYCDWPPKVRNLPIVGDAIHLDQERLIMLRPDLLILNTANVAISRRLAERGIRVISPRMETIDEVYEVIDLLGRELNAPQEAERLARNLRADIDAVAAKWNTDNRKIDVMVTFPDLKGGNSVNVIGRETFVHELIELVGGRNVVQTTGYPQMAMERAAHLNPEVIIISVPGDMGIERSDEHYLAGWHRWQSMSAVRNGRVHVLRENYLTLPGPRMAEAAKLLAEAIHGPTEAATAEVGP